MRRPGRRADRRPTARASAPSPAITDWAERTGRLTETPQPGDLILFGTEHVGIVESVNPDGTLTTVEGNASNGVYERAALARARPPASSGLAR